MDIHWSLVYLALGFRIERGLKHQQRLKTEREILKILEIIINSGWVIPLNNVNDRLKSMLGILLSSVDKLKREMKGQEKGV